MQMLAQCECIFALFHELSFSFVPNVEELLRRRSADEARVDETGKSHSLEGDTTGRFFLSNNNSPKV